MGRDSTRDRIGSWVLEAEAAGPGAGLAARRAAAAAEAIGDYPQALMALKLAARLDPLDPAPKLGAARLHAEAGDFNAARAEAEAVLDASIDQTARARAAFMLGELARVSGDPSARAHFETTLRIEDALLAQDRTNPSAARWYARARGRIAELDAAERQLRRATAGAEAALAMLRACAAQIGEPPVLAADIADAELRLGALELDDGRAASALRRLGEAIARYEALAVAEPDEPHWRAVLSDAWALAGEAQFVRGDRARARAAMDKALHARIRLAVKHPQEAWALAGLWRTRAALLAALSDAEGAAECLDQARALAEQLSGQAGQAAIRFLIHTLLDQADHALRTGQIAFARETADTARVHAEGFARARDADPSWLGETGACWDRLGEAAHLGGAPGQALEAFTRACELRRLALERAPQNPRFMRALAGALVKFADCAMAANAPEAARAALGESVRLRLALAQAAPGDDGAPARALATALQRLGFAAQACGDHHGARGAWEDELALAERLFADDDIEGQRFRAVVESRLVSLGGMDVEARRSTALARFDELARAGVLTPEEAGLRKKLWGG